MIEPPTEGRLLIDGIDAAATQIDTDAAVRGRLRRAVQIVFQNPYGSLNPRQTVGAALMEPLLVNGESGAAAREQAAREMLGRVGLREEHFGRYPHMFSGGQRQRIAIGPRTDAAPARAGARRAGVGSRCIHPRPGAEPAGRAAALARCGLRLHLARPRRGAPHGRRRDGDVPRPRGRTRPGDAVFGAPQHPYTQALLSATPTVDAASRRQRIVLQGELPSPLAPPGGCSFHTRCPIAEPRCSIERPGLAPVSGRLVACLVRQAETSREPLPIEA